jgi:predicted ester cyclase
VARESGPQPSRENSGSGLGCLGSYTPTSPAPGSLNCAIRPQPSSSISDTNSTPLPLSCSTVRSREELRRFYEALFSGLPDYYGEFDGTAIGDDTAVVWGHWGGTLSGNFMDAAVDPGRKIEIPVTFVCTFRDGLITSDRAYFDTATLAKQLGTDDQTAGYVTRFAQFWSDPAGELVPELIELHRRRGR